MRVEYILPKEYNLTEEDICEIVGEEIKDKDGEVIGKCMGTVTNKDKNKPTILLLDIHKKRENDWKECKIKYVSIGSVIK